MKDQQHNPSSNGVHAQPPSEAITAQRSSDAIMAPRPRFEMPPTPEPPSPAEQRAANRRTMLLVLVLMGGMAILGLLFALWTVPQRRANDFKASPPASQAPR